MSGGAILTLNAGSSSLRFALFVAGVAMARGAVESLDGEPHLLAHDAAGAVMAERRWPAETPYADVLKTLLDVAESHLGGADLAAVGHRVVHGGADHIAPERVTPALLALLEALTPLDPLHMPRNLAPIRAIAVERPGMPQVACFDTAFHHTLPLVARRFALPRALEAEGIRRYGFHGLSFEYIAGKLAQHLPSLARGRVIIAHLGAGASLCALLDGRSIDTTMGFSALDGLMMATRCGSLDPGVILYLGQQGRSFAEVQDLLYRHSGLLGVSEISGDLRVLLASSDRRAQEAIDLFTYRIALEAGAMASALGGLDGLVFTAGIGEHAPLIRAAVAARLAWLGLELDAAANAAGTGRISAPGSRVEIHVIDTDEEAMIAQHTQAILSQYAA
ncbi:acetate/propionate family kinase [Falsiroseomonas selenitidurans]|uniref:Acetate kinase n=1 Tax=Falsiroseomonas selenitidurans TaxID=2716335 RepID=A0ABX1EFD6_9PROT|nr:acetate/propionate family kinase [Falsiroseomonas selenitidurans]NKC33610.1 acetate/propionate family kinase [Falsiroseomonas selenitidurans]